MKPNIGDAKVDKILTQFSQMYRNESYISELIFPTLKVVEKTGKFAKYGKENLKPYTGQIVRAPGTRAHSVDYSVSQGSYSCSEKSLEKLVPDEMQNNTDQPYDPKRDATAVLMDNIWVNQELACATALGDTGIITQNVTLSGTDKWSDKTNSDPLEDIDTGINVVRAATGKRPNSIVFSFNTFQYFRAHPVVQEQLKYTGNGGNSDEAIINFVKSYFRIKNVWIGDAIYNQAVDGQSDSLTDIWANNVWLFHITDRPSIMNATFGYTFFDVPRYVDTYREEPKKSDVVRQQYSYDQCICDVALAYLIKSAV